MGLNLITAPASTPVSLAEAKSYLRILDSNSDTLVTSLIAAATAYLDGPNGYLGRAIISQTWELYLDDFSSAIRIPLRPVSSVTSVKYYDTANVLQTITSTNYAVDLTSHDQWIVPVTGYSWPAVTTGINNVVIRFIAGDAAASEAVKVAIYMLIAQWFDMPEASSEKPYSEMPHAIKAVLAGHRHYGFGG